jgi:hypothetical protein
LFDPVEVGTVNGDPGAGVKEKVWALIARDAATKKKNKMDFFMSVICFFLKIQI